ncbi:hypothetical protein LSH36_391g00004 [Paralvinella palmiformis]|uniref:GPI transamidase component PIG-S n=1 Tax=Paralvinella palmiformis TaxID=53620 RepID=A0AAD9JCQ4_9ANNE|nr:hypothetical protein LSH36_391g00004 [Paralvinella palmiformis]
MSESDREKTVQPDVFTAFIQEKSTQVFAALGVGFVCIVIGLPLWWKTTEVYRVPLPYQEISTLTRAQVTCYVDFTLVVFNEDIQKPALANFGENLKAEFENLKSKLDALQIDYRGQIRYRNEEEATIFSKAASKDDLDDSLADGDSHPQHGHVYFMLVPEDNELKIQNTWIGRRRNIFIPINEHFDKAMPVIVHVLKDIVVNEVTLMKTFYTAKGLILTKADKESMRSLGSHPGYDVTFTLLNPEPQVLSVDWDIKSAIQEYMSPMLDAFAQFAEITVKSQYLHFTDLGVSPVKDVKSPGFKLKQDQLPHIINPIEAYLNSHVSINPNINFVLYITPRNHYPLKIYDNSDELSPSNCFLSPRWGGIMIYNIPTPENVSLPAEVKLDMKSIMEVFLSQLRLLLGLNPLNHFDVMIHQPGRAVISDWELDQWLRKRTLENIATSTSTLRSLAQLLGEISNIVIKDDIAREVERAVSSVSKAQMYLQQSRLREAFVFARQALLSSEKAFFDPSLLELLYFPEDQKFAIYIPLFLPISIPVILSVIKSIKYLTRKEKHKIE